VSDPTVDIAWLDGFCPVQAEGFINGVPFYFRARGMTVAIYVGAGPDLLGSPDWHYAESYGDSPFAAGWMDLDAARAFIDKAAQLYAARST
jgi:hypothetical protein